jgi:cytochrome c5
VPLVFEVMVYRQTFGESLSVLTSDTYESREAAEAYAKTQRTAEMKASVYVRCSERGHSVGRTPDGVDFCQQCHRTQLPGPPPAP